MIRNFLAFIAALFIVMHASAQDVATAPQFAPRDVWVYEKINKLNDVLLDRYSHVVTSVSPDRITVRVRNEGGEEFDSLYTPEGNFVSSKYGVYETFQPTLKFPLRAGDSWKSPFSVKNADGLTIFGTYEVKVVKLEKVTVPAGEFDAWKLESRAYFHRSDFPNGQGTMNRTYWYAPAIKRVVLEEYNDTNTRGAFNSRTRTVLVGYYTEGEKAFAQQSAPAECEALDLLCAMRKLRPALGAVIK